MADQERDRLVIVVRPGGRVVLENCEIPDGIEIHITADALGVPHDAPDAPRVAITGCRWGNDGFSVGGDCQVTDCGVR